MSIALSSPSMFVNEIYSNLVRFQAKMVDHFVQLSIVEQREIWTSTIKLWMQLSMKTGEISMDKQCLVTDCLNIVSSITQQLIDSKSIFDRNDPKSAEQVFSTCLMLLDCPHINAFLSQIDGLLDELNLTFNVHLMLTIAIHPVQFLSSNANTQLNERTNLLILLMNYVEQRISSIELASGPLVERILLFFWNVSDPPFFASTLVKIGLPERVVRWLSYSTITTYEHCTSLISIIHNLSRHDAGVDALNQYEAIEIIKDFQRQCGNTPDEEISLLIPMILAQLCSPEQMKRDKKIMNDVLNQLLQRTMNASNSENQWNDVGFHVSEFLAVLVKLFVVEERTLDYILCHAETEPPSDLSSTIRLFSSLLLSFGDALSKNNQLEQFTLIAILNILWSISFQRQYLQEFILQHPEAVLLVENLAKHHDQITTNPYKPRSMEGIPEAVHGILHNIQKYSENHPISKAPSKSKPSIMISYSHDDRIFCKQLLDFLSTEQNQFDIWIDQTHCQIAEDIWELIAIGMEQAHTIVCLISDFYFQSKSCRKEFIYAVDTLHKSIIPVFLKDFKPKGWLGIRIPGVKYVRFPNLEQVDRGKMNDLLEIIRASLSNTTRSIPQWSFTSPNAIECWFSHYRISDELRDLYSFQTGEEMLQYAVELLENSEQHRKIYSRAFAKKYNGDELLPHEFQRFTQAMKELLQQNQYLLPI